MGVYLSEPKTEKATFAEQNGKLEYASSEMQGWRTSMEDAKISNLSLPDDCSVFGVFDGHGGSEVSEFVARHFIEELTQSGHYKGNVEKLLISVFLRMDEILLLPEGQRELIRIMQGLPNTYQVTETSSNSSVGCTAVVAYIRGNKLWVGNAGDSRCVLARSGRAIDMSIDHKPDMPSELERITKAGGVVEGGRVNGNINLSRSIGDFEYKRSDLPPEDHMVTAYPEVKEIELGPDDDFLVLACDGVWDMLTSQQCVDFVYEGIKQFKDIKQIVEEVLDRCLAPSTASHGGLGCDNMTCIIVKFNH